jgi:hypothetical protein
MKNLFIAIAFICFSSFAFANEITSNEISNEGHFEYMVITNESGEDTCYARFCWNVSGTQRQCTGWQEVPCNAELELEGDRE